MNSRLYRQAALGQCGTEIFCVLFKFVAQFGLLSSSSAFNDAATTGADIGKQIGAVSVAAKY